MGEMGERDNIIRELSFDLAILIILYCGKPERKNEHLIARQLLISGTSIGVNVYESRNAESEPDYIHKMKIALKEAAETEYWLKLIEKLNDYPSPNKIFEKLFAVQNLLSVIISKAKTGNIISNLAF